MECIKKQRAFKGINNFYESRKGRKTGSPEVNWKFTEVTTMSTLDGESFKKTAFYIFKYSSMKIKCKYF